MQSSVEFPVLPVLEVQQARQCLLARQGRFWPIYDCGQGQKGWSTVTNAAVGGLFESPDNIDAHNGEVAHLFIGSEITPQKKDGKTSNFEPTPTTV